jgi:hypothetical protein
VAGEEGWLKMAFLRQNAKRGYISSRILTAKAHRTFGSQAKKERMKKDGEAKRSGVFSDLKSDIT